MRADAIDDVRNRARRRWRAATTATVLVGLVLQGTAVAASQATTQATTQATSQATDPSRGTGSVTRVADGDTFRFRADGRADDPLIRLAGIQALELGECGAQVATDRLAELIAGRQVTLRSRSAGSSSDGRPVRRVFLGGNDVTEVMLRDGMGMFFPLAGEITAIGDYNRAAAEARLAGRGIWDPTRCGVGPSAELDMWVKSDADGDDSRNVNDEYVTLVNRASRTLDLGGWTLRESSQARGTDGAFRFPTGAALPPGARLRVRVGRGTDTATTFHMGSDRPLFDNADLATGNGDGVYLQDPLGNMREAFTWPCLVACTDPAPGLEISRVEYDPPGVDTADTEFVEITNRGARRHHLDGLQLRNPPAYGYEFLANSYLEPGETLRVTVGTGRATRLDQYWGDPGRIQGQGSNRPILTNAGDIVELLTWDEIRVDCVSWNGRSCFTDVEGTTHAEAIEDLAARDIARGRPDNTFDPNGGVSRAQMAALLTAALGLDPVGGQRFDDVPPTNIHAGAINALVAEGLANGVSARRFDPNGTVTRAQAASFLADAAGLERVSGTRFTDVPDGTHAGAINAVTDARIAQGVGGGRYAPQRSLARGQASALLINLLDR